MNTNQDLSVTATRENGGLLDKSSAYLEHVLPHQRNQEILQAIREQQERKLKAPIDACFDWGKVNFKKALAALDRLEGRSA